MVAVRRIAHRDLRLDAEEALILACCIQTLRRDEPVPGRFPGANAPAVDRLAYALGQIIPTLLQEQDHHDRYRGMPS